MNKLINYFVIIFACISCSNNDDSFIRNQIFEYVFLDRHRLNNSAIIIKETSDTIIIKNLSLIGFSYSGISIDSANNCMTIFSKNAPSFSHPFLRDRNISYIYDQLNSLNSEKWDTTSSGLNVDLFNPIKMTNENNKCGTNDWSFFSLNQNEHLQIDNVSFKDRSYIQISEPIYNIEGEIIVAAIIFTNDYHVEKLYYLKKSENEIIPIEQRTIVLKLSKPEIMEYQNSDGKTIKEEKRYSIVLGIYDI